MARDGGGADGGFSVFRGFLVHCYADLRRDRLYCVGRLEDGRSFAAVEDQWRPYLYIHGGDRDRAQVLLSGLRFEIGEGELESFSGKEPLYTLRFSRYGDRARAAEILENSGVSVPGGDIKPADLFLTEKYIRGGLEIRGRARAGRRVDLIIQGSEFLPLPHTSPAPSSSGDGGTSSPGIALRVASIDIETDTRTGAIRAVSLVWTSALAGGRRVSGDGGGAAEDGAGAGGLVRVWRPGTGSAGTPAGNGVFFHPDERSLLAAFIGDLDRADPDILTGWNILDFDLPRLSERFAYLGIPFRLGRSSEPAKYFPGETSAGYSGRRDRRSAAALVPGRQVLDALRVVRAGSWGAGVGAAGGVGDGGEGPSDYTLEAVSQAVLGEGKIVHSSGEEKIAELDRLYGENPRLFGEYCYRDAELVLRILAKTGLFRLTLERAVLTGVSLDKAWTSVASFERIYGMELRRRGIAPRPWAKDIDVSGAAGGTVLDSRSGLFNNVAVFDFRSLYPTIMRTFNIDPLTHARAALTAAAPQEAPILAPNGAAFSREPGPLPALIAGYFASRRKALDEGDETAARVYKILMNSFYGVLGTGACRYGRTDLAGAITSFARKWLLFSRDWFTGQGLPVLYGDTDSLFVETGLGDGAWYKDFERHGASLAAALNARLAEQIRDEYGLTSFIELRFEKAYRRFLIPPLRGLRDEGGGRGRAKGYGGYLIEPPGQGAPGTGGAPLRVEVKGMEAVRSDSTPLARRLQLELLELVFSGAGEGDFRDKIRETLKKLRRGELDGELVYRKRLSRPPETYTASTPPQVKAARALGWKNRRGTVEYVWTRNGVEPASLLPHAALDYEHYALSQVLPAAHSIASAAHWDAAPFDPRRQGFAAFASPDGQMELDL